MGPETTCALLFLTDATNGSPSEIYTVVRRTGESDVAIVQSAFLRIWHWRVNGSAPSLLGERGSRSVGLNSLCTRDDPCLRCGSHLAAEDGEPRAK